MKKILTLIVVLLLAEIGSAQDPGIWDTVRFGDWGVYLPCPPCSGIATVPIFAYHDEYLGAMEFHLQWTGPIEISAVKFTSEIDSYFDDQIIYFDTSYNIAILSFGNFFPPFPPPLPPGFRNIGYMVLLVYDTGAAAIDTNAPEAPPNPPILFVDDGGFFISPSFYSTPVHLIPQNIKPGDANGDGLTSLADIIYFVNYLFKNGSPPLNKQMADVNIDCSVNLEDLIFLINYIFKSGPIPLPSWCSEISSERDIST